MSPSLEVRKVTKKFGKIVALDDFSFSVEGYTTVALLGPNGAGKTTLMKVITGMIHPDSGEVSINGFSVGQDRRKALRTVGALVEQPEFYTYLTAREILDFDYKIRTGRSDSREEIMRVAELTGITPYLDRKTGGYSRGMKQRLGLASAMIGRPEIIILDEPSFGLDPAGMREFREIIRKMGRDKEAMVILSTHLIYEAREVCDRVLIIDHGRKMLDAPIRSDTSLVRLTFSSQGDGVLALPFETVEVEGRSAVIRLPPGMTLNGFLSQYSSTLPDLVSAEVYDDLEGQYVRITSGE
ncbi:bacitracin ABC transporter ATP-binding protein [Thermogymnomonas acidicola]|uniref:Bacitracin ABC transporter ATP-binding protein n=1 Tax=Thermogymnomonas acidicola TaxID=399579 RepID=A0AA37BSJ8_9ARCH|nr:ABC transporter ATP-binding protein [Thermogymnomonas acidicola]GGM78587.1 bacitracin ABC transporter ATP-binding protein [Thermogymnomonas acidicola]